jgi:hypothetical protein
MAVIERKMPGAVSLCPVHADEFYVPDCPDDYRCPDCEETMVRYVPADTYRGAVEAFGQIRDLLGELREKRLTVAQVAAAFQIASDASDHLGGQ